MANRTIGLTCDLMSNSAKQSQNTKQSKRALSVGQFEYAVMQCVHRLRPNAYGARICKELCLAEGRYITLAQVYVALHRLEEKGFVSSSLSDSEARPGGRRKRLYKLEALGLRVLECSYEHFSIAPQFQTTRLS